MIPRLSEVPSCFTDLRVYARLISSALYWFVQPGLVELVDSIFGDLALPVRYTEHPGTFHNPLSRKELKRLMRIHCSNPKT